MDRVRREHTAGHKVVKVLVVTAIMVAMLMIITSLIAENANAAGFNTVPPAGQSLLTDHFGVTPQLMPQGGGRFSFDRTSLIPANPSEVGWTEIDWFGTWSFNNWDTTTVWGAVPSGGEWYDVEAMYLDNDADNIYAVIITSCPHYYDWSREAAGAPSGVGIYMFRYVSYPIYKFVIPGDLCIDLGGAPRDEKGTTNTSYDLGIDIVHEVRNPKDSHTVDIWGDPQQHSVQSMRDTAVGYKLYQTTADPGGFNLGDPYLDVGTSPKYDWYTGNVHEVSEWQHTNFDPLSPWGTLPTAVTGAEEVTVRYYEYLFPGGFRENNAGTFIIEVTIPRSLLASIGKDPQPGDTIGIQWVTGCRNEGVKTASTSIEIKGTIGDFVWHDQNMNGCQDGDELGVEGVEVRLYKSDTTLADTTITDSSGYYQFSVTPGNYYIQVVKPTGWVWTAQDSGCDDNLDSDVDTTGKTAVFTLESGYSDLTYDAGMYVPGCLELTNAVVWGDLVNPVGVDETFTVRVVGPSYPGPEGKTMEFVVTDGVLTTLVPQTLHNLIPGQYTITEVDLGDEWTVTYSIPSPVTVSPGEVCAAVTVTNTYRPGCLELTKAVVWGDLVSNPADVPDVTFTINIQGPSYPAGHLVTFNLTEGVIDSPVCLCNLIPGVYHIAEMLPDDWILVDIASTPITVVAAGTCTTTQVTVTNAPELAAIGDYIWYDSDADGIQDSGEPGLDGVIVGLYNLEGLLASTTTAGGGLYTFTNLAPGSYRVHFELPPSHVFSSKDATNEYDDSDADISSGYTDWAILSAGETDPSWDAGMYELSSDLEIEKKVWNGAAWVNTAEVGETARFNITVTNTGNDDLLNIIVSDTLDSKLEYIPGSAEPPPTTLLDLHNLSWTFPGPLPPGQSLYIEYEAKSTIDSYGTTFPPEATLLKDYFGVELQLDLAETRGAGYAFDRTSFAPTQHTDTASFIETDWYGTWSFENWDTSSDIVDPGRQEPFGGEWYDVEAMYLDNDQHNVYLAIVTSCPFNKDWDAEPDVSGAPSGIGIYEPRYAGTSLMSPFVIPGDIVIDVGLNPRDEKNDKVTSYDFGIDLVHEQRNPKDPYVADTWDDPYQHAIQGMRDMSLGNILYPTTADPGGSDIGDPYLDLTEHPHYDWYTANVHAASEWQHTNFDPYSSWGAMPASVGNVLVAYYQYDFDGYRENNADTYIIEAIIPLSLLEAGGATIQPGEATISVQWITGCRNEGVEAASVSKVLDLEAVNIVGVEATGAVSQQEAEDSDSATAIITYAPTWCPWDDDSVITTPEMQEIINHWVNDLPKNGHIITTLELQELINMWLNT